MSDVMRQEFPDTSALASILAAEAAGRGLTLAQDTHYDANNVELSWWQGRICHRIDFQPIPSGEVAVTHYRDYYPCLPKLLHWLHNSVPLFPSVARVEWEWLGAVSAPFEAASIRALLGAVLPHNHSFKRTPDGVA
jgi:hypothetical protein